MTSRYCEQVGAIPPPPAFRPLLASAAGGGGAAGPWEMACLSLQTQNFQVTLLAEVPDCAQAEAGRASSLSCPRLSSRFILGPALPCSIILPNTNS